MMETFQGGRVGTFCVTQITKMFYSSILSTVLAKGEMEPERKETRTKVDEDRKHEYPYRPRPILMLLLGKDIFFRVFRHVINPDVTSDSLCNFFFTIKAT